DLVRGGRDPGVGPPHLSGSAERPVELDHGAAVARVGHVVGVGDRRAVAGVDEAVRGATSGGRGGGDVGAGGALAGLYVQGHDVLRVIVCPVGSQSSSTHSLSVTVTVRWAGMTIARPGWRWLSRIRHP